MNNVTPLPVSWNQRLGNNIKRLRLARGLSQEKLAVILGISFQQVQKYEKGMNRVSAERLCSISNAFDVKPSELLDGMEEPTSTDTNPDPNLRELVKSYNSLNAESQFVLRRVAGLLRSLEDKTTVVNT